MTGVKECARPAEPSGATAGNAEDDTSSSRYAKVSLAKCLMLPREVASQSEVGRPPTCLSIFYLRMYRKLGAPRRPSRPANRATTRDNFPNRSQAAGGRSTFHSSRPPHVRTCAMHILMMIFLSLRDVVNSMKALRKAFKKFENPYRRGVVSAKQFQAGLAKRVYQLPVPSHDNFVPFASLLALDVLDSHERVAHARAWRSRYTVGREQKKMYASWLSSLSQCMGRDLVAPWAVNQIPRSKAVRHIGDLPVDVVMYDAFLTLDSKSVVDVLPPMAGGMS